MLKNIELHRKKNVRDMGIEGKVKEKCLLRGDVLRNLNAKDIAKLRNEYRLKTVLDIRTREEIGEKEDIRIEGVDYLVESLYDEDEPGITQDSKSQFWKDPEAILPDMEELYRGMIRGKKLENVRKIMKVIMEHDPDEGSLWFHCTQGKDRTGVIAFAIYVLLGIDDEYIIRDYLYTNLIAKRKAMLLYIFVRIVKNRKIAEKVKGVYGADERYIKALLDEVNTNWGGRERFIRDGLKISKEDQEEFKRRYLIVEE